MMTASDIKLTFGYSTLASRVSNITFPQILEGQEFLVLVQNPNKENYQAEFPKAKIMELVGKGVAKSRNAAIRNAKGTYLIFADDDITFSEAGLQKLVEYFEANPECAIIMACIS